ncbi:hypothetical protein CO046_02220 [Candidatus Peregrinibacteria bacterium CG_4_9_14_0_2_um_filter_53_11]|nr:MAG: hypothetical protein CO046_02220 [Candidatus Peregrinibacteria bacterium CG_4_9_14_0_2_um_filter_53_11]
MDLLPVIKNIGLSDKESRVYLACLELGSSAVSEIARRARINRVTCYSILEKLMQKGLISSIRQENKILFDATDPRLVSNDMTQRAKEFRAALPEFRRLRGDVIHPNVRYFEGLEGVKAIYEDTLTSSSEILNYSNSREIRQHWPEYDSEYVSQRVKHKIFLRGISPMDEHGLSVHSRDGISFREIRLVPSEEFTFTNEINIYDDKVAIISFQDVPPIGMIIQSAAIAATQRDIFTMAWRFASAFDATASASGSKRRPARDATRQTGAR